VVAESIRADTLDFGQCVGDLVLAVDIRVKKLEECAENHQVEGQAPF